MRLWIRQIGVLLRNETIKNVFSVRALIVFLLAALPLLLVGALVAFAPSHRALSNPGNNLMVYSGIYEGLILRTVVFFGCAWTFMNLVRGEVVDKCLHYYFLAPVRREVLLVGKYLSGVATTTALFGLVTVITFAILCIPRGADGTREYLLASSGLAHLALYLGSTMLGCIGYGAVFLAIGLFFRNPIFPALVVYGWEFINFLLPPLLKKASVVHYIQSLLPVPLSQGPFAIVAEPTPAWLGVPGLLAFVAALLVVSAWRIRTLEISYSSE
jgi:ABC-type transport system involved in multi-copper enzyme maturation permease subunit